jgi:hypothetical protein
VRASDRQNHTSGERRLKSPAAQRLSSTPRRANAEERARFAESVSGFVVFSVRVAQALERYAVSAWFGEITPTPTPPGREGQKKWGPVTQGGGSKTRLCPGLSSYRPFRTSVCAGAWVRSVDSGEMTPTPNPSGLGGGRTKRGRLTQRRRLEDSPCPGLLSHRPYRTSVCAGAWIMSCHLRNAPPNVKARALWRDLTPAVAAVRMSSRTHIDNEQSL